VINFRAYTEHNVYVHAMTYIRITVGKRFYTTLYDVTDVEKPRSYYYICFGSLNACKQPRYANGDLLFLVYYSLTEHSQRISKCLCHHYESYKLLNIVRFFGSPCNE